MIYIIYICIIIYIIIIIVIIVIIIVIIIIIYIIYIYGPYLYCRHLVNRDAVFHSKSLISIPPCENLIHKLLTCFLFFVISTIQNQWSFTVRKGNKVWQSRHSERCRGPQNEQSAWIRLWFSHVLPLVSIPWINGSRSSRRTGTLGHADLLRTHSWIMVLCFTKLQPSCAWHKVKMCWE